MTLKNGNCHDLLTLRVRCRRSRNDTEEQEIATSPTGVPPVRPYGPGANIGAPLPAGCEFGENRVVDKIQVFIEIGCTGKPRIPALVPVQGRPDRHTGKGPFLNQPDFWQRGIAVRGQRGEYLRIVGEEPD